jgi:hypothetical protein
MFQGFRDAVSALRSIAASLGGIREALHALVMQGQTGGGLEGRVKDIELAMDKREAQADATLMQAEAKLKSARAAEERERRLAESHAERSEGDQGGFSDDVLAAYADAGIPIGNDAGGIEEGMPPVRGQVAPEPGSKQLARNRKWGRS